ncbi:mitochondrial carrier [Coemansia reversa NRRL 1564]|uniref:Mitochondrial carrier n=1 Tax=Coemansia reversa (strain ATCC 12441 / NRRL 1564) TaxID=763665 RepID=A0A2G5B7C2_COERN|nr:mitochondrial carrier [Coemansia reversa NRRL 1564]|eukprot:PIA14915.1 mitochondrial carrier [Coemansia reversa NRRL 1564]
MVAADDGSLDDQTTSKDTSNANQTYTVQPWQMFLYENRTLASAITAAVTGMVVGYPFDSLKTRMQTHHYPSLLTCAQRSISEEGIRGLYRGLLPPLLTASAAKSLSFSLFEQTKQLLRKHDPYSARDPFLPNFQRTTVASVALTAAISGGASGTVIALLCCPLELIKVQMQLANLMNLRPNSTIAVPRSATQSVSLGGNAIATVPLSAQVRKAGPPTWATSNISVLREIIYRRGISGAYYGLRLHISK